MLSQLLLYFIRIGSILIHFIDRYNDGNARSLGVVNCLDGLRHDAIICCNYQDRNVGNLCAAGAHGSKRFMARRIQEGNGAAIDHDSIRADMLSDAACLR